MKRIKRQFGAAFADAMAQCPTLLADLNELRRRDMKIRRINKCCQAYSFNEDRTMFISSRCSLVDQLLYFGHEAHHLLHSRVPILPVAVKTMSRSRYVRLCLDEETDCVVHECLITQELIAAGYKIPDGDMTWYRRYRRGGRAAVRKAMAETQISVSSEKYPAYYARLYDQAC